MDRRHRARGRANFAEPFIHLIGLVVGCLYLFSVLGPASKADVSFFWTLAVLVFVIACLGVVGFFVVRKIMRSHQAVPAVIRCIDLSSIGEIEIPEQVRIDPRVSPDSNEEAVRKQVARQTRTASLPANPEIRSWPSPHPALESARIAAERSAEERIRSQAPCPRTLADQLHEIDWFQFEKLLEAAYRARGYGVERRGGAKADGGIDLVVTKEGETTAVQCKHWKKWVVRVRLVREMIGALKVAGFTKAIIVTLKGSTSDAQSLAAEHGIQILTEKDVLALLESVGARDDAFFQELLNDQRKFCPRCESEMVLRTATRGLDVGKTFWGCSRYPRCKYILRAE